MKNLDLLNLEFKDVLLLPKKSIVSSRKDCDTSIKFGNYRFQLPVIPANMPSIITKDNSILFSENKIFYCYHRISGPSDVMDFLEFANINLEYSSISVGVKPEWETFLLGAKSRNLKIDYLTIDVAYAYNDNYIKLFEMAKNLFPETFLIVGNGFGKEWIEWLENTGYVDAAKVGIGVGSVCRTKHFTGIGSVSFSDIIKSEVAAVNLSIIADGGIRFDNMSNSPMYGDVAKSICAGADMVMSGLLWKGCEETPASKFGYEGNASKQNKNSCDNIEGIKMPAIKYDKSILDISKEVEDNLQSSISYVGGNKLKDLKSADWRIIYNA